MKSKVGTFDQEVSEGNMPTSMQTQLHYELKDEVFPRASVSVIRYCDGKLHTESRNAICEHELSLVVNGDGLVTLLCSNVALRELAYGFLYTESIIESLSDVRSCSINRDTMTASFEVSKRVSKPACPTISSGFGGKIYYSLSSNPLSSFTGSIDNSSFVMSDVVKAMSVMRSFAREYTVTRGIHCSALFKCGVPLASFEDVGRHNTFDKLAGYCLLNGQREQGVLLTTTGRISGEMVRKAIRLGVSGIASLSGPTDKAIVIAQAAGVFLVGYVNETSAFVYSGM